jgi:poly-gamma-glutamate synthesis protein (capsule biosynthesis protein)
MAHNPFVVGNFEAAVPPLHAPTQPLNIKFSVSERYLAAAKTAGFTHFSLANNHSRDFGSTGFENTKETLADRGLESFGDPTSLGFEAVTFLETQESRVALIGISALNQTPTKATIERVLDQAATESDFQIAYVHWGTEYASVSNVAQQDLATVLVEAGADLIIGHHPHVVQEIGLINQVPVIYSLGNYIFDQYFSAEVQTGLIVQLNLQATPNVYLLPVTQAGLSQPTLMSSTLHQRFLTELAQKSHPELSSQITTGILELHSVVATSTEIAIIGRNNPS